MSRFMLSCSLIVALSTVANAERVSDRALAPHFAQPPNAAHVNVNLSDRYEPPQMPHRIEDLKSVALDRATVRAALAQARATNFAAFLAYQKAGVFPSNTFKGTKLNVWRDEGGHFCAAATIIRASGQSTLVDRVADQTNFIRLADVRQGPLMDWILASGFTQDEIAEIQEPFMPVTRRPVLEPQPAPVLVDARLRKAEDARLRAKYIAVDRDLVARQANSLDLATDRLMKHQDLAWRLVNSTIDD